MGTKGCVLLCILLLSILLIPTEITARRMLEHTHTKAKAGKAMDGVLFWKLVGIRHNSRNLDPEMVEPNEHVDARNGWDRPDPKSVEPNQLGSRDPRLPDPTSEGSRNPRLPDPRSVKPDKEAGSRNPRLPDPRSEGSRNPRLPDPRSVKPDQEGSRDPKLPGPKSVKPNVVCSRPKGPDPKSVNPSKNGDEVHVESICDP